MRSNFKSKAVLFAVLCAAFLNSCVFPEGYSANILSADNKEGVFWKNSDEYANAVKTFKITPDKAYAIAMRSYDVERKKYETTKYGGDLVGPVFIVGKYYCIGRRTRVLAAPVYQGAGYYVHGVTGKLEYRNSDQQFAWGYKGAIQYTSIVNISEK